MAVPVGQPGKDFLFTKGQKFAMDIDDSEGEASVTLEIINDDHRPNVGVGIDLTPFAGCIVEAVNVDDQDDRYIFFNCDNAQDGFKRGAPDEFSLSFSGTRFKLRRDNDFADEETPGPDVGVPIPEGATDEETQGVVPLDPVPCKEGVTRTIGVLMAYDQKLIDERGSEQSTISGLLNAFTVVEDVFSNTMKRGYWRCDVVPRLEGTEFVPRGSLTYTRRGLLASFADWHRGEMNRLRDKYSHYDHMLLNTPNTIDSSWGGQAYIGSSCDQAGSVGVVLPTKKWDTTKYGQCFAHELGHNLGMDHDENGDTECREGIMDYAYSYNVKYYGECSADESMKFIGRSCYYKGTPERVQCPDSEYVAEPSVWDGTLTFGDLEFEAIMKGAADMRPLSQIVATEATDFENLMSDKALNFNLLDSNGRPHVFYSLLWKLNALTAPILMAPYNIERTPSNADTWDAWWNALHDLTPTSGEYPCVENGMDKAFKPLAVAFPRGSVKGTSVVDINEAFNDQEYDIDRMGLQAWVHGTEHVYLSHGLLLPEQIPDLLGNNMLTTPSQIREVAEMAMKVIGAEWSEHFLSSLISPSAIPVPISCPIMEIVADEHIWDRAMTSNDEEFEYIMRGAADMRRLSQIVAEEATDFEDRMADKDENFVVHGSDGFVDTINTMLWKLNSLTAPILMAPYNINRTPANAEAWDAWWSALHDLTPASDASYPCDEDPMDKSFLPSAVAFPSVSSRDTNSIDINAAFRDQEYHPDRTAFQAWIGGTEHVYLSPGIFYPDQIPTLISNNMVTTPTEIRRVAEMAMKLIGADWSETFLNRLVSPSYLPLPVGCPEVRIDVEPVVWGLPVPSLPQAWSDEQFLWIMGGGANIIPLARQIVHEGTNFEDHVLAVKETFVVQNHDGKVDDFISLLWKLNVLTAPILMAPFHIERTVENSDALDAWYSAIQDLTPNSDVDYPCQTSSTPWAVAFPYKDLISGNSFDINAAWSDQIYDSERTGLQAWIQGSAHVYLGDGISVSGRIFDLVSNSLLTTPAQIREAAEMSMKLIDADWSEHFLEFLVSSG
eukprot:Clim_evm1s30 gene=Clim_evmTU1s30